MPIVEAIEALLGVTRRLFLILSPYQHPSPLPKLGRREESVKRECATENSLLQVTPSVNSTCSSPEYSSRRDVTESLNIPIIFLCFD